MSSNTLLSLIDTIYSAAADPSQWTRVAEQVQRAIGGHSINLALEDLSDSRVNLIYSTGVDETDLLNYEQNVMGRDEMTDLLNVVPECSAFTSQDFYDVKAVRSLYCYEAFYEKVGYSHFNVGLFYRNEGRRAWISVARSEQEPLYTPDEYLLMQAITPHLRRAFMINMQLLEAQMSSKVTLDALEHIAAGVLLLSNKGLVVHHNQRAEPYLHQPGHSTREVQLRLPDHLANHRLHALIEQVSREAETSSEMAVPFIDKGTQKVAFCFPWRSSAVQHGWLGALPCAIVFILSPREDRPHTARLRQAFGLSVAEVKVLQSLIDGQLVSEIAQRQFVSEATVRFHIHHLLRKTQSRNQAELVAKVLSLINVKVE